MKSCPNCHRPMGDNDRFCQYCGATMPPPKKRKIWLWIVLAVVLLAAVGTGIFLVSGAITENRWQEQYDLGMRYLDDGDYEEAALAFLAAIEIDPERADAYLAAAEAYVKQGDYDEAVSILKKGVRATGDEDLKEELEDLKEEAEAAEAAALIVGSHVLSASDLNYYFVNAAQNLYNSYGEYLPMMGLDPGVPLNQQIYDEASGMTWADYFLEQAIDEAILHCLLWDAAMAEGYTPDEAARADVDAQLETIALYAEMYDYHSVDAYLQAVYGPGATEAGYAAYLERGFLAGMYYAFREEQVTVTADALREELDRNSAIYIQFADAPLVNARHILILPQGGTYDNTTGQMVYSEAEWQMAQAKAEDVYQRWLELGSTEEAFAELANTYSDDGDGSTGGLYTDIYPGQMITAFNDWCFDSSRRAGDSGIIRTEFGWHVMYFVGSDTVTYREKMAEDNLRLEAMEHWLEELTAAGEVTRGGTDGVAMDLVLTAG